METRPLTEEQHKAVDEDRNLVVAAAGSGKTTVIVAKAGWLLHRRYRRPSELLLLAFAKDARDEMEMRVRKRLGNEAASGIAVKTFHGLGMAIIGEAEGKRPALARAAEDEKALIGLLKGIVSDLATDRGVWKLLLSWFQSQFAPYRSEHEFRSQGEYWNYVRRHEIRSLNGEQLRSYEECEVANFLFLNGVSYEYERVYEHDTATPEKGPYRPDFYLPGAGIYIEHFGVDAAGNTAPYVPQKKYLDDMEWKRQTHAEHGTVLIETFSHEHAAGRLTENLAAKLNALGVTLTPISRDEVFAVLERQGRIGPFMRMLATFLKHYKDSRLTYRELARRATTLRSRLRAEAFLAVFRPVFERYEKGLLRSGRIDFDDMITRATGHVEAGRYHNRFGYILVDEFQDISPGRARLLKALLEQSPSAQLFAVGDDWQAIFRFAGSDIAIMREFEERFGKSERVDLETTFRCADGIARVATKFVLRNPAQIRKTIRSTLKAQGPCVHVGLSGTEDRPLLSEALNRIAADAATHLGVSSVMLLSRYSHLRPQNVSGVARQYPPFAPLLDDRARLKRARSRLCGGARSVLGEMGFSNGDRRRPDPESGARGSGGPSQCRGAAFVLCRHDSRPAPRLPSRGWRSRFLVRPGTDRRKLRYWRLRTPAGTRRSLSTVRRRPPRAPRKRSGPWRLPRLFELAVLRAHAGSVSRLREGAAGQERRAIPLPQLRPVDRGLPEW